MFRFAFVALCLVLLSMPNPSRAADSLSLYMFGNSLVHHLSDTDETAMPHWLAFFASAAGKEFRADGRWGFMRDFAQKGPKPQWSFKKVTPAWQGQNTSFEDVSYDVVMVNPANFIQYQGPEKPYRNNNDDGATPVSAALDVIDRTRPKRLVLYEGWAVMKPFIRSFPPSQRRLRRYLRHNESAYHEWYVSYVDALRRARPDVQIELLPVAKVLAELLEDGVLRDLRAEDLYVDEAPHGTATLYFLAGAISYVGLFQAPLPADVATPETIHPLVREKFSDISETIHAELGISEQANADGFGLGDPSLAMGLAKITDWSRQQPFLDRMKTARRWVGHLPGQWGGWSSDALEDGGYLDEQGWVWGIPPELASVESFILTEQSKAAQSLKGLYRVTYEGQGDLAVTGRARVVKQKPGEIWFDYTPGRGLVGLKIRKTDPERSGDYIRNIVVLHEAHIELHEAGALFNPDWIDRVADLRLVRFMDWMVANGSPVSSWDDRPRTTDFSYTWRGVPIEVMLALVNEIGADMWVTLPHMADDTYVRRFAGMVKQGLDPGLRVFAEYSNEMWNFGFPQTRWAREQAEARWGRDAPKDAWIQYAGMRAAEVADIWAEVFGEEEERLTRVVAVHTGWKGLEQAQLTAPLAQAEGKPAPAESFDGYAVTGYFGIELGTDDGAPRTREWIKAAKELAHAEGEAKGLKRVRLDQYVAENYAEMAIKTAAEELRTGSLNHLLNNLLPYHAEVAAKHGLALMMYEGGSHVVGVGAPKNDDELTDFFVRLNYSNEMGELYQALLKGWHEAGGTFFNAYVDLGRPGKWGSWGVQRYLEDENPRHTVLTRYNRDNPASWETRAPGVFLHGDIIRGTDKPDTLSGTSKRDIFLAGKGDDVIHARGLGDRVHGGAGRDRVILPLPRNAYRFSREGGRVIAIAADQRVSLFSIEEITFDQGGGETVQMSAVF